MPRFSYLTEITNIPILFYRLDGSFQRSAGVKQVRQDNKALTLGNRKPKTYHEVYEALEVMSGALRR
jgi:hypothetical protein